jgi:hypothetical protein
MSQILFNRTVKTNIIIYPNDGTGRDCYIYFNNGGFWKDNIKRYSLQEKFKRSSFARFRSIRKTPPIWNYHADGSGRDSYILYDYGGLINNYKVPRMHNFRGYDENLNDNYLRKTYSTLYMSADEKKYQDKLSRIQKDVVNRLYYKPRNKFRYNILKRDFSHENVFNKLKLESVKTNPTIHDNKTNIINVKRFLNNNHSLRNKNYLDDAFNEEKNNNNERTRNKLGLFKSNSIKCLSQNFGEKTHYPFNQFKRKMNLVKGNLNKRSNLFNY